MTDAEYNAWLADRTAQRIVLAEIDVRVAGTETTLYFGTVGYNTGPNDTPPNQHYAPALNSDLVLNESLSVDSYVANVSIGDLGLLNVNGVRDAYRGYVWANRDNRLYLGGPGWPRSDFRQVFDGKTADLGSKSRDELGVKLRDKLSQLNSAVTEAKLGGSGTNQDALKPNTLGEVFNMTPVNDTGLTYWVHNGLAEDIPEVRDEGLPVEYTKNLAAGKFTLARPPSGAITCDVQGSSTGGIDYVSPSSTKWRISFTANNLFGIYVADFQLRDSIGVPQAFSGQTYTTNAAGPAASAADGLPNTYWYSTTPASPGAPQWWQVDYASPKSVRELYIESYGNDSRDKPKSWELQYWNGSAWVVADTRTNISWDNVTVNASQVFTVALIEQTIAGAYANTVSTLVQRLATGYGKATDRFVTGDLDTAQLAAFDTANPQPVGMPILERVNVLNACRDLAASVGAQLSMTRLGKLRLLKISTGGTPVMTVNQYMMVDREMVPISRTTPVAAVKLGFCKNWTVQEGLTTGLSGADKELFATEWLTSTAVDPTVAAIYRLPTETEQQDTMLLKRTDADAEALRRLNLQKVPREVFQFTGYAELFGLQLGDTITVVYPRFGLDAGVPGQIVSMSTSWARNRVTIGVLI